MFIFNLIRINNYIEVTSFTTRTYYCSYCKFLYSQITEKIELRLIYYLGLKNI